MEQPKKTLQLSDFTRISLNLFKCIGVRLFKAHPEEKISIKKKVLEVLIQINFIAQMSAKLVFFFLGTFQSLIDLTAYACYLGFVVNSSCKILAVWHGRFILHDVIVEMEKIFPKTNKEMVEHNAWDYFGKIKFNLKALVIYHFSTTTLFNLFPLLQSSFEYLVGGDFVLRFPYYMHYPFDPTQPAVYPFIYIFQVTVSYTLSCMFVGSDILLCSTVHVICMYFDNLANKIENFEPTGTDEDLKELNGFIQYHNTILSLSYKINQVFSVAILMNYCASCGVVCLIGFQVTAGSEILDSCKFFAFLISSLVHVYFICQFGTNLLTMSSNISEAVFAHKWYLGNNKYKKMLVLLIARAQKPVFLTAFKFFIVSMESFKALMTTSYQFFALIKTKYDEDV